MARYDYGIPIPAPVVGLPKGVSAHTLIACNDNDDGEAMAAIAQLSPHHHHHCCQGEGEGGRDGWTALARCRVSAIVRDGRTALACWRPRHVGAVVRERAGEGRRVDVGTSLPLSSCWRCYQGGGERGRRDGIGAPSLCWHRHQGEGMRGREGQKGEGERACQ